MDTLDEAVHVHRRPQSRTGLGRLFKNAPQAASRVNTAVATWIAYRRLKTNFDVIEVPDWGAEGFFFALARSKPLVGQLHTPLKLIARYSGTPLGRDGQLADLLERPEAQCRSTNGHMSPVRTIDRICGRTLMVLK